MKFEHPLARNAKVWQGHLREGGERDLLVVVTTLELDPKAKKYKPDLVGKLRDDVNAFLSEHPNKASGFVLMNKPKS